MEAEATPFAPGGVGGGGDGEPGDEDWEDPVDWGDLPLLPAPEDFHVVAQAGQVDSSPDYTFEWATVAPSEEFELYPSGYRIYANERLLAELGAATTTFTLSPASLPRGRHLLFVVVLDQYGRESLESDLISLEVDPLITVGSVQDNRQFSAKVEVKRIINQYFPVSAANDTVGHQAYQPTLITNVPWGTKWNCYPLKIESRLTVMDYLESRTLSDLTVGSPGVTSLAINSQGAYRFRVENHDRRARRVKFRWVEVFCPFPVGTVMGANADNEYRENSQIIPDINQNAIREVTLELEDGDEEASSEMYRVSSPEERGQVRVYLLDESLDVSATPAEVLAGADALKRPVDANKPAGGAMSYTYDVPKDYVIERAESGDPDIVTWKPKGPLYEFKLALGLTFEENINGNMRLPLEHMMLTCPDGNEEKLEVYAEHIATGVYTKLNYEENLVTPYFRTKAGNSGYRFYLRGVAFGEVTLRRTWVMFGSVCDEDVKVTILPANNVFHVDSNRDGVINEADYGLIKNNKPWRFWINDDSDNGDIAGEDSDMPEGFFTKANYFTTATTILGNESYGKVGGRADLTDFFPVWLNLKPYLEAHANIPGITYQLRHEDKRLNVVWSKEQRENAFRYLTEETPEHYGRRGNKRMHEAETRQITQRGIEIPAFVLRAAKDGDGVVIYLEGRRATDKPLYFEILRDGIVIRSEKLYLSMSSVEKMFRHMNLRDNPEDPMQRLPGTVGNKDDPGMPERMGVPANNPDDPENAKWLLMLHGFRVTGQAARAWHCEMFKRLYWSGNKARFIGVSWFGNPSAGIGNIVQGYHRAVRNAVPTAAALAGRVNALPGASANKTVMGHSQGCWLSTLAVADYGMEIGNLFLLNAAFARECFDGESATDITNMVPSYWWDYPERTWASNWHKLFEATPDDTRASLTWKNRLSNALTMTNVHSFYSSTEDVLGRYSGAVTSAILSDGYDTVRNWDLSYMGRYSWVLQEKTKGDVRFLQGNVYGGWGFNLYDPFSLDDPVYWKIQNSGRGAKTPAELGELSDALLRRHPLFSPGWGDIILIGFPLRTHPPNPVTMLGAPEPMHDLYGTTGSVFASMHRHQLLAEMIPALSLPVGANHTSRLPVGQNYDMPIMFANASNWPRGESDSTATANWKHSDAKDIAYFYVNELFRKITEISNQ